MKNEKEWTEHLRNRMEGYTEPLPEGLWDTLAEELEVRQTPKVIPIWRRWQVAAAAAGVVLFVSSLTYWFWSSPKADFQQQELAVEVEKTPLPETEPVRVEEQIADALGLESSGEQPSVQPVSIHTVPAASLRRSVGEEVERMPEAVDLLSVEAVPAVDNGQPAEAIEEEPEQSRTTVQTAQSRNQQLRQQRVADQKRMKQNAVAAKKKATQSSGFSIGVGAGNTPYSALNTFDGMGSFVSRSAYHPISASPISPSENSGLAYSQVLLENAIQSPQTSVKHHMPVTVGFSVAWHFHEDWALETGLNYTLLSSDIHSGAKSYVEETQKLHYIGIPVRLHRSIWKNNWLSIYASAGGAVEKCVSGKLERVTVTNGGSHVTENVSLDDKPLQWSVAAAAGAQVNFTSRLGLYLEPGVAYYFDDHSGVETIRKEHPFNFNLQLGLRVNLTK